MMYEQQAANLAMVMWIIGAVVTLVALYFVIRLAVTHAIRATRESRPDTNLSAFDC